MDPEPYQVLPPLADDEYDHLRTDISRRGVLVPVEYDENGHILDGHHRVRACEELGITDWPRIIRAGLTEEEKLAHVLALNLSRRHLSREQRRALVATLRAQGWSYRRIGAQLGVDKMTAQRDTATVSNDTVETVIGANGKRYPATRRVTPPSVFVPDRRAHDQAAAAIRDAGPALPARLIDTRRAQRIAREHVAETRRAQPTAPVTTHDDIEIRLGDFRAVLDDLAGQVAAIITDPPYGMDALQLYDGLSLVAARLLAPDGVAVVMTGQLTLPEVIARLATHLRYRWTAAYVAQGARTRVHAARVATGWKPLLLFTRQDGADAPFLLDDVFDGATGTQDGVTKPFHHWGQSEAGMAEIVERCTRPGDLVVDPFLGGGTTAIACRTLGRRFVGCDIDPAAVQTTRERLAS